MADQEPPYPVSEQGALRKKWTERANDYAFNELPNIRSVAEKWTGTVTALAGLSTIIALLQGTDKVAKLGLAVQVSLFAALVIALGLAVSAIYLGTQAAYGEPGAPMPDDWELVYERFKEEATTAARKLKSSQKLALIASILIILILATLWFAPQQGDSSTEALVVHSSGQVTCGTLQTENSTVSLTSSDTKKPQPLTDVASFTIVSHCP
jgi:hypothetical protein